MNADSHVNLGKIPQAFEAYFREQGVRFPTDLQSSGGIRDGGWQMRYVVSEEAGRTFMEVYATHRKTDDQHVRIWQDGELETLPAVSQGITFNPDIAGDKERAERERRQRDDPLIADLRQKRLLP